ncbi:MAG: hypothetical protein OXC61_07075 [Flavobacteriaceae bacterium]|nr:hypothetical protein [Flavobacteriaceae bacterium]
MKNNAHGMRHQNDSACDGRGAPTTHPKRPKFLAGATDPRDHQCTTETPNRQTIGGFQYAFQTPYHPTATGPSPAGPPNL